MFVFTSRQDEPADPTWKDRRVVHQHVEFSCVACILLEILVCSEMQVSAHIYGVVEPCFSHEADDAPTPVNTLMESHPAPRQHDIRNGKLA